ncbi:MAG: FadR family transcriptional regulator [Rhizobiaceae bacterium]|nr:FadR family transcriptional regulator [Rhizobiaceae bacterium]
MSELLFYDLKESAALVPSLVTQVCREIGRRIVAGHLREGELIDDESRLCDRYSVSKSVVREAVKLLVAKGLLEVRRGSGTRVKRRASWNLLDDDVLAWHQGVEPRPDFLRQLMDVRQVIEPNAAAWAAETGTAEQISAIRNAQEKMDCASTVQDYVVADALFHRAILRAANNEVLMAMEGVIFSALLTSIRLTNADPRDNKSSASLHGKVLKAIEARDGVAAASAMNKHLADTRARLAGVLSGGGGPKRG